MVQGSSHPHALPWRETPLIESPALSKAAGCRIFLKLENLQPSGSFKSRGIGNLVLASYLTSRSSPAVSKPHFLSSSGGNAGLAAVLAASTLGCESTVIVPLSTKPYMIAKIREAGATEVVQMGKTWFEADTHLRDEVLPTTEGGVYVPPFDDPRIWEGASGMVEEWERQMIDQEPRPDRSEIPARTGPDASRSPASAVKGVVCSVGGGGLFCGVMQGLDKSPNSAAGSTKPTVIAVETVGAESLHKAIEAKELITLPGITSLATTLGATKVCAQALEYGLQENVKSVTVTDEQAVRACLRFADDHGMLVEPACGASLAIAYEGMFTGLIEGLKVDDRVVIVVCGGRGVGVGSMSEYRTMYSSGTTSL